MGYRSKSVIGASYSKALNPSGAVRDSLEPKEREVSAQAQREKRGSAWRNNARNFERYEDGGALSNDTYGSSYHYRNEKNKINRTAQVRSRPGKGKR